MTDSATTRYARNLDRVRRRRGPAGDLTFLSFTGAHEYEPSLVVTEGWFAEFKRRNEQDATQGEPIYLAVEVVDLPGNDCSALLKEEWRLAVEGRVFTIDKDRVTPPLTSPRFWGLQAYRTDDEYQAAG